MNYNPYIQYLKEASVVNLATGFLYKGIYISDL